MRKIITFISMLLMIVALASCGEVVVRVTNDPVITLDGPGTDGEESENPTQTEDDDPLHGQDPKEIEFTCKVLFNKKPVRFKDPIQVVWANEYEQFSAEVDTRGIATVKGLDGEYHCHLVGVLTDTKRMEYTYNPNDNEVSNFNPECTIELSLLNRFKPNASNDGKGMYSPLTCTEPGYYRTLEYSGSDTIYYHMFVPKQSGVYEIESLMDIYSDQYNPKITIYTGSIAYVNLDNVETRDTGGTSINGYTKNFKWSVRITEREIGNVFRFAIRVESKENVWPVFVDFSITHVDEWEVPEIESTVIPSREARFKTENYNTPVEYKLYNMNGSQGSYVSEPPSAGGGSPILSGKDIDYDPDFVIPGSLDMQNPVRGVYRKFTIDASGNKVWGEPIMAYIDAPCPYVDLSLTHIEDPGNKVLTVEQGTENYRPFIYNDYKACCNSDGVCYVTKELKEFLQKFAISSVYFCDGNGWVEFVSHVYASEEDQWLFACCYYKSMI